MKKYTVYIILLAFLSCKSYQPKEVGKDSIDTELSEESHIMFYILKAKQKENEILIDISQIKKVKGKLKGIFTPYICSTNLKDKYWLVNFQNSSKNNRIQLQIKNPLIEQVEFVNDENNLEKRVIHHKEKEFVIRVPYDNSINSITFESLIKENQKFVIKPIDQIDL